MNTYAPLPVRFVRGRGAQLYDESGRAYLDAVSGIAVTNLGHAHPGVTEALQTQAGQLLHTSNLYRIPWQDQLGRRLCGRAGMDRVFFCNSGTEANEAAVKLARLYARRRWNRDAVIIAIEGGFHGRTFASLSASGSANSADFAPLLPGFAQVPFNDPQALEQALEQRAPVAAVLLEAIQGEGGVITPDPGYLQTVRALCDQAQALLILDEVQTGMCRTGKWFANQHEQALPDIMTLAKALGNGMPIGACLARGEAAALFTPGSHGATFGGNPLAARAALAVLEALEEERLAERAAILGAFMLQKLQAGLTGPGTQAGVREIRGKGLMLGIELERDCTELPRKALEQNLLINVTAQRVIRLLPPLIIDEQEAGQIAAGVCALVTDFPGN